MLLNVARFDPNWLKIKDQKQHFNSFQVNNTSKCKAEIIMKLFTTYLFLGLFEGKMSYYWTLSSLPLWMPVWIRWRFHGY